MNSLIDTQMENIEKVYESLAFGERVEFSKSALESIHQILRELKEYRQLEETGLLVKLPCKVGDILYDTCLGTIEKCDVISVEIKKEEILIEVKSSLSHGSVDISEFGISIFKKRKEAENKLKEMKNNA